MWSEGRHPVGFFYTDGFVSSQRWGSMESGPFRRLPSARLTSRLAGPSAGTGRQAGLAGGVLQRQNWDGPKLHSYIIQWYTLRWHQMSIVAWHPKSPAIRLFVQQFVQPDINNSTVCSTICSVSHRSRKTPKPMLLALYEGNPPVAGVFL